VNSWNKTRTKADATFSASRAIIDADKARQDVKTAKLRLLGRRRMKPPEAAGHVKTKAVRTKAKNDQNLGQQSLLT
jgi:hypothetical protein